MPELSAGPPPRYLLFSVDTEPDDPHWRGLHRGGWTHENLRGLGRLAEVCRGLGVRPTFFVSHSVAVRGEAADALLPLLREGLGEVGGHLHPGDTPPFGDWDLKYGDNILRLPDDLLEAKFGVLHGELGSRFGRPTSYRSAAWALDARVVGLLERHGYLADSSVTPGVSWRLCGRPSYLGAPRGAYRLDAGDLCVPGAGRIVEVPVSIWSPRAIDPSSREGRYLGDLLTMPLAGRKGISARMLKAIRPQAPAWLRPAFKSLPELMNVARRLHGEEFLHVMCHSNELWPRTSPYVSDAAGLDEFYRRLTGLLRFALAQGYIPVTMSEYAGLFTADRAAGRDSKHLGLTT